MNFQTSALILSWIAILLLALVVSGLVRQVHALSNGLTRMPTPVGPRPGAPAPAFDRLAPASPATTVLLFLDADCSTCTEVLDEAAGHAGRDDLAVRALYQGDVPPAAVATPVDARGGQGEFFERYDAVVRPFAVVVDPAGQVVRSEPIGSRSVLRNLLAQTNLLAPSAGPADTPPVGHATHPGGTP